jgi:hypothetical protein
MPDVSWTLKGKEFVHCNCDYGCPCQFNSRPTHGRCSAILAVQIDEGHHGEVSLSGLNMAGIVSWPGAIHEGHGEVQPIIDARANEAQRSALLRIMSGEDTRPGATFFQVFASTYETVHEPVFATIAFEVDVAARQASIKVPGLVEGRGEPILNPVTGEAHRARIELPSGFEYSVAEVGRGYGRTQGAVALTLEDTHAHFAALHMTQDGVVR